MASDYVPTHFLTLPNELIEYVFKYLSPIDLVVSFGHLSHCRLQHLIAPYISSLNLNFLNASSVGWLDQHLLVVRQHVKHVRIGIKFVEKLLELMPVLDALTIRFNRGTQHLVDRFIASFQTVRVVHIGALTLSTYDGVVKTDTANFLLGGNGQLPEHMLNVNNCLLQLNIHRLPSYSRLRYLNCTVQEEAFLHALCARLPHLETLKIVLLSHGLEIEPHFLENFRLVSVSTGTDDHHDEEKRVLLARYKQKDNTDEIIVTAPACLRVVSITGHIAKFDRISQLFELASTSLKKIKLDVQAYSVVDPDQVNRVGKHINFDFRVHYNLLQLPVDFDWKTYIDAFTHRPILRCQDKVFCSLSSVMKKSVFWLQTTKMHLTSPEVLCLSKVRTLQFQYCRFTIDTNTVQFIRETFPSMHTLIWRLPPPRVTTKIPLDMVHTLVIHSEDRNTLQCLFLLCPNVTRLNFTRAFRRAEELPELNEKRIQNTCEQIKWVQLVPEDKEKKQLVNKLFPNAKVTCDARPFYEKMF